jgi:hypothetical protein
MAIAIVTSMSTTIQTRKRTANLLKELMKKTGAKSYDEVIAALAKEKLKVPKSMFGSNPSLKPFTEEEESQFHEF